MTKDLKNLILKELVEMNRRVRTGSCTYALNTERVDQESDQQNKDILRALKRLQGSIEKKDMDVGGIISDLNHDKKIAEQDGKAKSDFLSMISHEIRTPLNAIIGIGHILMNESPREDQLNYIKSLRWSGESLLALINDVLDFNKIEAGKVEFESTPFNILDAVQGAKESFVMKANEQNNELVLRIQDGMPEFLIGDPTRLTQILNNLISNAIKFTKNGCVRIDVGYDDKSDAHVDLKIDVSDTGVGIASDKQKEIFKHFSQADSRTNRQFGGTGLGLTITKQLIELQNGNIKVESELGVGSVFSLIMPFQVPEQSIIQENAANIHPKKDGIAGIKVLVVEDIAVNRLVVEKFMLDWGVEVDLAENGKEAIHMVITERYDLVLMDLQMPVMDGFIATEEIRKLKRPKYKYQKLPIIALTAASVSEIKEEVFASGMNDIVTKPINPVELYKVLQKHGGRIERVEILGNQNTKIEPNKFEYAELLDFSYFNKLAGEDMNFFKKVVCMSVDAFETFRIEYAQSMRSLNFDEVAEVRHKIIASLNNLKIKELLELMEESKVLQKNKNSNPQSDVEAHLNDVDKVTERVIKGLKERVSTVLEESTMV
ncbi:His Kinase A (phospho-acceptor) domain-containing protein [Reichenbachiella faecimaris]|uniref:histidine kinase n=1 Tax=Reichenbachiella faecimaris TaxID=692418 RepID=A0A1W2G8A2_REIFA|nr:ATP-binding protein [Reichenbachiella faecimaris]SMD32863.1 His Kinase A (phospho-acceptor) domain-containing protein [Reichenbachiella faecimaris]